jgi:CBS domain-containing protein
LLAGSATAYVVSCLLLPRTLMTEKIARRKVLVPEGYAADPLERLRVRDVMSAKVITLAGEAALQDVRAWLLARSAPAQHQGFPLLDDAGRLLGVVTHRDIMECGEKSPASKTVASLLRRPPVVVYDDCVLREAVDHMMRHGVGRLPVMARSDPGKLVGIISRSDILAVFGAHARESALEPDREGLALRAGRIPAPISR